MHSTAEMASVVDKRILRCSNEVLSSATESTKTTYGRFLGPSSNAFAWGRLLLFAGGSESMRFEDSLGIGIEING